ncbi:MAG: alpha glucosidase [Rhodobacteraceae bacterium]|nr:alpha glucosidase [Paracoccaceae bacterium]MCY4195955.1 alpha glucosidase [Paracoccaceae bacterium]MCY4328433.1 alpha glucosidase [Paracoccaceae bacterium]
MTLRQACATDASGSVFRFVDPDWWRGAVIYQIYIRSFQDSNADGIGDLRGIEQRLPYVASLGADVIWISPFMPSPMKDFGYDVSDYRDVAPELGSLEDFDHLVETTHRHGLRLFIDLVLNHTSDQHPWFRESRSNRENRKSAWYVWSDPKPDGTPPNNWLSIFGGSAWSWDARREQYYLHNFLASQPDLNFHCKDVQDAILEVAKFWLDRGVDGFRLDTINFYFHDKSLRDNPPLPADERNPSIAPRVNPYNYQEHIYSKNQPENLDFLKRLRGVMDSCGAIAFGEIGEAQNGLRLLGEYTSSRDKAHMCYAFEFLSQELPTATRCAKILQRFNRAAPDGWACWSISNHDVVRHTSRWELTPEAEKAFCTLMMCLRGTVCLYQGEELGLPEAELSFEQIRDPYGREFWPEFKGRDGCRTPMSWSHSEPHAGFSTADATWLPLDEKHLAKTVSQQEANPSSLIHHYRKAIRLRSECKAMRIGDLDAVSVHGDVLTFERSFQSERAFCAFNLSDHSVEVSVPQNGWHMFGDEVGAASNLTNGRVELKPWQTFFARKSH